MVRSGQKNSSLPITFQGLPNLPFDRVIIHCYQAPTPHHIALIYELRRVVVPDESVILLFHHRCRYKGEKGAKRWRNAMRLMGFSSCQKPNDFISVWNGSSDFKMPRCKTERSLEEQPPRFYQALLRDTKRVLEIFPQVGTVSKKALALGIPVTIFLSGSDDDDEKDRHPSSLVKRLGGQFP